MADLETDVPQNADEALDFFAQLGGDRGGQQNQQIDVGVREKLTASVAAHRNQHDVGGHLERAPHRLQLLVDDTAVLAQQFGSRLTREITFAQCVALLREAGFPALNGS